MGYTVGITSCGHFGDRCLGNPSQPVLKGWFEAGGHERLRAHLDCGAIWTMDIGFYIGIGALVWHQ